MGLGVGLFQECSISLKCSCRTHEMPYIILLDMRGTTYTFRKREEAKSRKDNIQDMTQISHISARGVVRFVQIHHTTNPTNYKKWSRVHTLVE